MNNDIAVEILRELWRYKTTDKYTEIEIRRALETAIEAVNGLRPHGVWKDYTDDGYVECPFCGSATNCEDNIDELHYCFSCGASMSANDRQVIGKLNSEIEKSNAERLRFLRPVLGRILRSEIVPDYRDGWRLKEGETEWKSEV